MAVGDLIVLSDVIDRTCQRERTYYAHSPLGYLRQFPTFCPTLRSTCLQTLSELNIAHQDQAIAAVTEGPRLETPAEVRMLGTMGAEVVTHSFIPEMFLARELQMCYAAVCYVVNYAETGSRHRPLMATGLFEAPSDSGASRRLIKAMNAFAEVMGHLCRTVAEGETPCTCGEPIARAARDAGLGEEWRTWLDAREQPAPEE
jgi:5'-methylthioadenosine phosphorylase